MPERDPILNIQPVDPFNPKPTIIVLRYDEPKQVEGKYGTQFLYGITDENGQNHVLFASQALDGQIHQLGAKAGDKLAILRSGAGKDTRWTVRMIGPNGESITGDKQKRAPAAPAAAAAPTPPAHRPKKSFDDRLADYLTDLHTYVNAYGAAIENLKHLDDISKSIDLNAAAFVIYKMAKDNGIELDNSGNPVLPEQDEESLPF